MSMDIVLSAILTKRILLLNADTKIPAEEKNNLNRSVSEAEKVEGGRGSHWNNLNDVFISSPLTYLLRALLRIRPQRSLRFHFSLLLYFKSWPGITQVVDKIRVFVRVNS